MWNEPCDFEHWVAKNSLVPNDDLTTKGYIEIETKQHEAEKIALVCASHGVKPPCSNGER